MRDELARLADTARVPVALAGAGAALLLGAAAPAPLPRISEVLLEGRGWALASLTS